nr:unnamed protein product [Callosobruchus analis]
MADSEKPKGGNHYSGTNIHSEITDRWESYLRKAFSTEEKKQPIDRTTTEIECRDSGAPQTGHLEPYAGLSAIIVPLDKMVKYPVTSLNNKLELLLQLADVVKAITGAFQLLYLRRRYLIMPSLNENHRTTVQSPPVDEHLLGADLQKTLKSSQALTRVAQELNVSARKNQNTVPSPASSSRINLFHRKQIFRGKP